MVEIIIVIEIMKETTDLGILRGTLLIVVVGNVIGNESVIDLLDTLIEATEGIGLGLHSIHHTDADSLTLQYTKLCELGSSSLCETDWATSKCFKLTNNNLISLYMFCYINLIYFY